MGLLLQEEYEAKFNAKYDGRFHVVGKYTGGKHAVSIECDRCHTVFDRIAANVISRTTVCCPKCDYSKLPSTQIIVGVDDMCTTHPEKAVFLKDADDGQKYSFSTHCKLTFVCPLCGAEYNKRPRDMFSKNGSFRCAICSDGFSYPEKFLRVVLDQVGASYIYQFSSKDAQWCSGYRYDFYLPDYLLLIETNGNQHYGCNHAFYRSLAEQQRIDKEKIDLAVAHNMRLIQINCSNSTFSFMRDAILRSALSEILDLSKVDWGACGVEASSSLLKDVCHAWDGQYNSVEDLAFEYHMTPTTVRKYLRDGGLIGFCNYDDNVYKSYRKRIHYENISAVAGNPIMCIETGVVYNSYADVKRKTGMCLSKPAIGNPQKTSHGFHWVYIEK